LVSSETYKNVVNAISLSATKLVWLEQPNLFGWWQTKFFLPLPFIGSSSLAFL